MHPFFERKNISDHQIKSLYTSLGRQMGLPHLVTGKVMKLTVSLAKASTLKVVC